VSCYLNVLFIAPRLIEKVCNSKQGTVSVVRELVACLAYNKDTLFFYKLTTDVSLNNSALMIPHTTGA